MERWHMGKSSQKPEVRKWHILSVRRIAAMRPLSEENPTFGCDGPHRRP
jgi:hypothetical protein